MQTPKPYQFIGVVHVPPMPGDPRYTPSQGGFEGVERAALADAKSLAEGGVDAIIFENFGSAPFSKGTPDQPIPPHQVALLTHLARTCKDTLPVRVGVNCLRNDVFSALGIAAAMRLDFVRVNVHTGSYVTDQGLIEGAAHLSLRYRQTLHAQNIHILADVLVKHATPLAPVSPHDATADCVKRGLADGVIVTGQATGAPIDTNLLREVRKAAPHTPIFLGSGVTPETAPLLVPHSDAAIVGTWLKHDGDLFAPVDPQRVRTLRTLFDTLQHAKVDSPS